ncbi:MAG: leucyl aminopeptidase family protein, partial [Pseudomonadota bacterium]
MHAPCFAPATDTTIPLWVVNQDNAPDWVQDQSPDVQKWLNGFGFNGGLGQTCVFPVPGGQTAVVIGAGTPTARARKRFGLVSGYSKLPAGSYALAHDIDPDIAFELSLGWLLSEYRFDRYRLQPA